MTGSTSPRPLTIPILLLLLFFLLPALAGAQAANGLTAPADGAVISGVVAIQAVAKDPSFSKWQVDVLAGSPGGRATFLALGVEPLKAPGTLARWDTTPFPDGAYTLRLRVVRQDGNYEEYFSRVTIANRSDAGLPAPAPAASERAGSDLAGRLGLPSWTEEGQPVLYLTFDDGPTGTLTPRILELLARYDARATFFFVGRQARRTPDTLRAIVQAGQELGNHTQTHLSLVGLSQEQFDREVGGPERLVQANAGDLLPPGSSLHYLRPPYGSEDDITVARATERGYQIVNWDLDPKDWRRPGVNHIVSYVLKHAFPGAVVLLHDGGGGSLQTVEALQTILEQLGAQGYRFLALGDDAAGPAMAVEPSSGSQHGQAKPLAVRGGR